MSNLFTKVFRKVLPNGRAWNIQLSIQLREMVDGFMVTADRLRQFFIDIKNDVFPDTTRDLSLWEQQFSLPPPDGLSEQQRRDRLAGRWAAQGGQSTAYMEQILAQIGITAKIYENFALYPVTMGDGTTMGSGATMSSGSAIDPNTFLNFTYSETMGSGITMGDGTTMSGPVDTGAILLVNGFIPGKTYNISDNPDDWIFYWIMADPAGIDIPVNIPVELESVLITTLLQIKPVHTRGILNVNFF